MLKGAESKLSKLMQQYIKSEVQKRGLAAPEAKSLEGMCEGLAKAITEHFLANGEVATGIPVTTSGGAGATSKTGKLV